VDSVIARSWGQSSRIVLALSLWLAWQPAAETSISSAATAESSIADLAGSSFAPAQKPIIEIAVGDAVRTDTARGDHDTSLGTQVDPLTWKHLVLKCRKVDGSTADVELLRPSAWMTDQQAEAGGTIEVSVECLPQTGPRVMRV
jgi:hypothetical protein